MGVRHVIEVKSASVEDKLLMVRLSPVFQSYTASVLEGSNPTFKWTVDDKPFFTYYNTVLNVIYQHAAVYKLTVSLPSFVPESVAQAEMLQRCYAVF